MAVLPFVGPWPFLQFRIFFFDTHTHTHTHTQTVGLLGGVIAPRKAATCTQDNTNRINAHTDIHALSGV
jgi:hypothetical protein